MNLGLREQLAVTIGEFIPSQVEITLLGSSTLSIRNPQRADRAGMDEPGDTCFESSMEDVACPLHIDLVELIGRACVLNAPGDVEYPIAPLHTAGKRIRRVENVSGNLFEYQTGKGFLGGTASTEGTDLYPTI